MTTCHKLGRGNSVRSLHELSKSARVGEGKGKTKAFLNFLCIFGHKSFCKNRKERVQLLGQLPVVVVGSNEGLSQSKRACHNLLVCSNEQHLPSQTNAYQRVSFSLSVSDLLIQ
jgi:hypothetical protein